MVKKKEHEPISALSAIGYILGISYPVLALSTGVRSMFQLLFRPDVMAYPVPALLSGLAALCYLVGTLGFFVRRRGTWWLSVGSLGFETLMTFIVGTLSFIEPELVGRTAWRHFGADYGFFPLFQPIIGLVWLMAPATRKLYGFDAGTAPAKQV
jgi:hypothetical protein